MAQWISGSFDIYVDSRGSMTSAQVSGFHTLFHDTTLRHVMSRLQCVHLNFVLIGSVFKKKHMFQYIFPK